MKKLTIVLSMAFMFGLSFMIAINFDGKDLSSNDLASIVQNAQAGPEGCWYLPNQNMGSCIINVNGSTYNCVTPQGDPDCHSD